MDLDDDELKATRHLYHLDVKSINIGELRKKEEQEIEQALNIIKNNWLFTTTHKLDEENKKLKESIERIVLQLQNNKKYEVWLISKNDKEHEDDIKMIDETRDKCIEYYKTNDILNKIIIQAKQYINNDDRLILSKSKEQELLNILNNKN